MLQVTNSHIKGWHLHPCHNNHRHGGSIALVIVMDNNAHHASMAISSYRAAALTDISVSIGRRD
jgi:hypothetical protein